MHISRLTLCFALVLPIVAGCTGNDKGGIGGAATYEDCFHEDGSGLPAGWSFDATHWACEGSPISRDFELNTGTFPQGAGAVEGAWDDGHLPWNNATANLSISRAGGAIATTFDDSHNAVYYLPGDHHPSQIGWLAATLCHPKGGNSPEANDCDTRIFSDFLDAVDDPNTPQNEERTSVITWTTSNTSSSGAYRMPMAFAHELHHAIGFSHNDGIGSITESTVGEDQGAPTNLASVDVDALQWVYGL